MLLSHCGDSCCVTREVGGRDSPGLRLDCMGASKPTMDQVG